LLSSKPVHLDLKVTSDLVRMRWRGSERPKLGGTTVVFMHCVAAETLDLRGNGRKWRPLGRGSAIYWDPASQQAAGPRGLSGAVHGDPMD
jgi:hypothetical protein